MTNENWGEVRETVNPEKFPDKDYIRVVVDIVKHVGEGETVYLFLQKRSHEDERYDEVPFELPGGKIEGDEDISETALRELDEETGLSGEISRLPESSYFRFDDDIIVEFYPVLVEADRSQVEVSEEHVGYGWLTGEGVRKIFTPIENKAFEVLDL